MIDSIIQTIFGILKSIFGFLYNTVEGFFPGFGWAGILAASILIWILLKRSWGALKMVSLSIFVVLILLTFLIIYQLIIGG